MNIHRQTEPTQMNIYIRYATSVLQIFSHHQKWKAICIFLGAFKIKQII